MEKEEKQRGKLKAAVKELKSAFRKNLAFPCKFGAGDVQTASSGTVSKGPAPGRRQNIAGAAAASGGAVHPGALQSIGTGGRADGVLVMSGGLQTIGAECSAVGTRIASGGAQHVGAGQGPFIWSAHAYSKLDGFSVSAIVSAGGVQTVYGTAIGAEVYGTQMIASSGTASGGAVRGGGRQTVYKNGTVCGMRIDKGAEQFLFSASASGIVLAGNQTAAKSRLFNVTVAGGVQTLRKGASASVVSVVSGGRQIAARGARVESAVIASGGRQKIKYSSLVSGAVVKNGGRQIVEFGEASLIEIRRGGRQSIWGGKADEITIFAGGVQNANGTEMDHVEVRSGGAQGIAGGKASYVAVASGALQIAKESEISDAQVSGTQKMSGGRLRSTKICAGGTATLRDVEIMDLQVAGSARIGSGCTVSKVSVLSGGRIDIMPGVEELQDFLVKKGGTLMPAPETYVQCGKVCGSLALQTGAKAEYMKLGAGASLSLASGTETNHLEMGRGASLSVQEGAWIRCLAGGGTMAGTLGLTDGARLEAAGADMRRLSVKLAKSGDLVFAAPGTVLGSLTAENGTEATFCIADAKPGAKPLLSVNPSKAPFTAKGLILMDMRQRAGTYRLASGLKSAAKWNLEICRQAGKFDYSPFPFIAGERETFIERTIDGDGLTSLHANGKAARLAHGMAFSLNSSGGETSLRISLQAGGMLRGAAKGETLSGTKQCDVFWGGAGNDAIKGVDGSDVAVYGKGAWGKDVVAKSKGAMTILFKDVKKSEVSARRIGDDMVFTRKADKSQSVTVRKWNAARNAVVFGTGAALLNKWIAGTSMTDAQLSAAQKQAWKAAKIA